MPFPSSIGFLHEQSNIIITTTDFDDENNRQHQRQVPRWLLEFHQEIQPLPRNKSRPSTDNNITTNRPKWFEELSQKRRMSDIVDLKFNKESLQKSAVADNNPNEATIIMSNHNHYLSKFDDNVASAKDYQQTINNDDEVCLKPYEDYTINKISNKSMDIIDNADDDDDNLFTFTTATLKSIENLKLDEKNNDEDCIIPEMPTGIQLCLTLMENWGDQNFIGLNGLEILDRYGNRPAIENVFLYDDDENRKENNNDLYKLIDNVYRTHDDAHIWQCRTSYSPIRIIIRFEKQTTIALIRIWNYNKSRIHSYRGVKFVIIQLDDKTIFCGEIAK
ncbi:hypothetical protein BLA29_004604, partial [Euroglyphus maynei]